MDEKVELGDRVRDRISGLRGIVIARIDWLYKCRRFAVAPEKLKDGTTIEEKWFDEPQLVMLKKRVVAPVPVDELSIAHFQLDPTPRSDDRAPPAGTGGGEPPRISGQRG